MLNNDKCKTLTDGEETYRKNFIYVTSSVLKNSLALVLAQMAKLHGSEKCFKNSHISAIRQSCVEKMHTQLCVCPHLTVAENTVRIAVCMQNNNGKIYWEIFDFSKTLLNLKTFIFLFRNSGPSTIDQLLHLAALSRWRHSS